jgi:hypothetical protein
MKLDRWDWDRQAFIQDEFPDELFRPFLNWLFTTKTWVEYPDLVNAKVLQLQRAMAEYRQGAQSHREAEAFAVPVPAPVVSPQEALAAKRRASLVKARAARKAKKELQHA